MDNDIINIISQTSTGKTYNLFKYLEGHIQNGDIKSILIVTPITSLSQKHYGDIKELPFGHLF